VEITPDKKRLTKLVEAAYDGDLCLPHFQRDFVWTRDQVGDLIRSVLRGYFIGSLLLLSSDPDRPPFAPIALTGASAQAEALRPTSLVLDGQQRLTALLYALVAPGTPLKNSKTPRRYFVNLDLMATDPDSDDIVFDRTTKEINRDDLGSVQGQWESKSLPCTALFSDAAFRKWLDGLSDWLRDNDPEGERQYRERYRDEWSALVEDFRNFVVPVVALPQIRVADEDAVARVCAIFEKLNSTGVELSVYDLLTARLYPHSIDVHALWEEAVERHHLLAAWSEGSADTHRFGVLVLRTLALQRNLETRTKTLINLKPENFERDWRAAAAAIERALEIVTHVGDDGFGVFHNKWMPSFSMLPVFAVLRSRIEVDKLGDTARSDLRRWYWSSVFLGRYAGSVETITRRDFTELGDYWSGGDKLPEVFEVAQNRIGSTTYTIRDSASMTSSVYSGVFCLLANSGARDWYAAEAITLQSLEDHHIFPKNFVFLRGLRRDKDKGMVNSIVNRTLISDTTNARILDAAPAEYLDDPQVFSRPASDLLPAHFVEPDSEAIMREATVATCDEDLPEIYRRFCDSREATIVARIRSVCGVKVAGSESDTVDLDPDD